MTNSVASSSRRPRAAPSPERAPSTTTGKVTKTCLASQTRGGWRLPSRRLQHGPRHLSHDQPAHRMLGLGVTGRHICNLEAAIVERHRVSRFLVERDGGLDYFDADVRKRASKA